MERSNNSLERVRNLLAAMDRSIDQARARRLKRDEPEPTHPEPRPAPSEPTTTASGRPKARRMDPSRVREDPDTHAPRQAI